jgi:hypothetical protein
VNQTTTAGGQQTKCTTSFGYKMAAPDLMRAIAKAYAGITTQRCRVAADVAKLLNTRGYQRGRG